MNTYSCLVARSRSRSPFLATYRGSDEAEAAFAAWLDAGHGSGPAPHVRPSGRACWVACDGHREVFITILSVEQA